VGSSVFYAEGGKGRSAFLEGEEGVFFASSPEKSCGVLRGGGKMPGDCAVLLLREEERGLLPGTVGEKWESSRP